MLCKLSSSQDLVVGLVSLSLKRWELIGNSDVIFFGPRSPRIEDRGCLISVRLSVCLSITIIASNKTWTSI